MVSRISAAIRCDLSGSALRADRGRARKDRNPISSERSLTGSKGPPQPGQRSRRWSAASPSRHTRALQVTHLEWAMLSHASVGAIAFKLAHTSSASRALTGRRVRQSGRPSGRKREDASRCTLASADRLRCGTGPTVDPVASRVRCLVALARIGVEPLSGRDYWPQGQPRTRPYSSSPGTATRRDRVLRSLVLEWGDGAAVSSRLGDAARCPAAIRYSRPARMPGPRESRPSWTQPPHGALRR